MRIATYTLILSGLFYGYKIFANCISIEINSQFVKLPIGMNEANLIEMGEIFSNHPEFANMRAMILYGSRLHHDAGYKPIEKSDLDITFISMTEIAPLERVEVAFNAQNIFQKISDKTGFKISEEIPTLSSESEILLDATQGRFNTLTPEAEQQIWRKTETLAQKNGWNRNQTKEHFLTELNASFSKDALIIIKGSGHNKFQTWLISRHYNNILIVE